MAESDILNMLNYLVNQRGHGSKFDADSVDLIEGAEILQRNGTIPLTGNWNAGPYFISCAGVNITDAGTSIIKLLSIKNNAGTEVFAVDSEGIVTGTLLMSCGCYTQPTWTKNLDYTVTIGAAEYVLATESSGTGRLYKYSLPETTLTLTDETLNYIVCDYNSGSPLLRVLIDVTPINETTIIPVYTIYRSGTLFHTQSWDTLGVALINKLHQSIVKTQRYRRQTGLAISVDTNLHLALTGGIVWVGATRYVVDAFDSNIDFIFQYYHASPTTWDREYVHQYNNFYYDTGSARAELTNNHYVVNWIFRGIEEQHHAYLVMGTGDYLLPAAEAASLPVLPPEVSSHALLVGKIIIQKNATTATSVLSAFDMTSLSTSTATSHNDLTGIQGGVHDSYYHSSVNLDALRTVTKDPTGFDNPNNISISYDSGTRQVTLTGTFQGYWQGAQVPGLTSGWVSPANPTVSPTVGQFLYYNGSSYVWTTDSWTFDMLMIAFIAYDAAGFRFGVQECHGLLDNRAHQELHQVIGTYLSSGGDVQWQGAIPSGTTATRRRPQIGSTAVKDEDNITTNPALVNASYNLNVYTRLYLSGGAAALNWEIDQLEIVRLTGANPYYNQWTGTVWQQTPMANNTYMSMWLIALPATTDTASQKYRYIWVQGQTNSSTLANEQAVTFASLSLGALAALAPEMVVIQKAIIKYSAADWEVFEVSKITGSRTTQVSSAGAGIALVDSDYTLLGTGSPADPLRLSGTYANTWNLTKVTDQLALGTTNVTTITSVAPAASRTYTIRDAGAAADVMLSTLSATNAIPKATGTTGVFTTTGITDDGSTVTLTSRAQTMTSGNLTLTSGNLILTSSSASTMAFTNTTSAGLSITNSTLTTSNVVAITKTSTAGSGSPANLLIQSSGVNANLAVSTYGIYTTVTNTNVTSGTNIAYYASASAATTANYSFYGNAGILYNAGNVGIGSVTPTTTLDVRRSGVGAIPTNATANITLVDTSTLAADTGAAIYLGSYYTGTTIPSQSAFIKSYKESAVDGEYGFGLKFGTRQTGQVAAVSVTVTGAGNMGIGTMLPGTDLVGTYDYPNTVRLLEISGLAYGRLLVKGSTNSALDLVDTGAGSNVKWMQLISDGGITKFIAMTDAAGVNADNILSMDQTNGNVGVGQLAASDKLEVKGNVRVNDTSGNLGFSMQYDNTTKALKFVYVGA